MFCRAGPRCEPNTIPGQNRSTETHESCTRILENSPSKRAHSKTSFAAPLAERRNAWTALLFGSGERLRCFWVDEEAFERERSHDDYCVESAEPVNFELRANERFSPASALWAVSASVRRKATLMGVANAALRFSGVS